MYYSDKQSFVNRPNVVNLINMEGKELLDESLSEFIKRKLIKRNNISLNLPNSKINSKDGISTSAEDGGVGVPSFAILSSALMIESVSDVCLNMFLNYYGNFPPYGNNTSICNTSSLWNEENELIELIKLKYGNNKNLQLQNKNNDEIIQIFLDQENDNNIIQYYSFNGEFIIGVLTLPAWYISYKNNEFSMNNNPVVKSSSTNTGMFEDTKKENPYKRSNSEIINRNVQNENLTINPINLSPIQYNAKECISPEHTVLFDYDNLNLKAYSLERKQSESSLYDLNMKLQSNVDNNDKNSETEINDNNDLNKNKDIKTSENSLITSSEMKKNENKKELMDLCSVVVPLDQPNENIRKSMYSTMGIKSIDDINTKVLPKQSEDKLKDKYVAYIVRNYTGKFTWISSLKYENNDNVNKIINHLINNNKKESTKTIDKAESLSQENFLPRYCNSTSNINMKLNEEDLNKIKELKRKNKKILESNENDDYNTSSNNNLFNSENNENDTDNKKFKILNCTCFNESELPSNKDIIDDKNKISYEKIEKISEILINSEKRVLRHQNQFDIEYKE